MPVAAPTGDHPEGLFGEALPRYEGWRTADSEASSSSGGPGGGLADALERDGQVAFGSTCGGCHVFEGNEPDPLDALSRREMRAFIERPNQQHVAYELWPSAEQRQVLLDWLTSPSRCAGHASSLGQSYSRMLVDLESVAEEDRPYTRYFSFAHRANAGACEEELARERRGLIDAINGLSRRPGLVTPVAVDSGGLYLRIDLRDLGWERALSVEGHRYADFWAAAVDVSAFSVPMLGPVPAAVREMTGTAAAVQPADAFIAAASQGPLYYAAHGIPRFLTELPARFGTSAAPVSQGPPEVARALIDSRRFFARRIVEWRGNLERRDRGYWVQFAAPEQGEVLLAEPRGQVEVLFGLENGLTGFAIYDGSGERVTRASRTGVEDVLLRAGTDCRRCHGTGPWVLEEERTVAYEQLLVQAGPRARPALENVYGAAEGLRLLGEAQRTLHQEARRLTGALDPLDTEDPASEMLWRFERPLDREGALGELFTTQEEFSLHLDALPPELRGLESPEGAVSRAVFAAHYRSTLCIVHSETLIVPAGCD